MERSCRGLFLASERLGIIILLFMEMFYEWLTAKLMLHRSQTIGSYPLSSS